MAILIREAAKCAVCGKPFCKEDGPVCFSWFDTTDPLLQGFSDAGAHFSCIAKHSERRKLESIYLNQIGKDGIRPNGRQTFTISPALRMSFDARQVVMAYGPLFLTLEIPKPTAKEWLSSTFWKMTPGARFMGRGFKACFEQEDDMCQLSFLLCPHGTTPDHVAHSLLRSIIRWIPRAGVEVMLKELYGALAKIS